MNDVYALFDLPAMRREGLEWTAAARAIEQMGIGIVQYRHKHADLAVVRDDLRRLRTLFSGVIIVNDRIEAIDDADGLHVGQEDLAAIDPDPAAAVERIRRRIGDKVLGLSTHTAAEIAAANRLDLEYIGLGAYRPSQTKTDARVHGDALIELARASVHPVALIGGVRLADRFDEAIAFRVVGTDLYRNIHSYMRSQA
jgi:thiamine-phosphate pyrophosphorylase